MFVIDKEMAPVAWSSAGQSPRPTVTACIKSKRASGRPSGSATIRDWERRVVSGEHGDGQVIAQHAPSKTTAAPIIVMASERDTAAFTIPFHALIPGRALKVVAQECENGRVSSSTHTRRTELNLLCDLPV
jgi:hypothetical protein